MLEFSYDFCIAACNEHETQLPRLGSVPIDSNAKARKQIEAPSCDRIESRQMQRQLCVQRSVARTARSARVARPVEAPPHRPGPIIIICKQAGPRHVTGRYWPPRQLRRRPRQSAADPRRECTRAIASPPRALLTRSRTHPFLFIFRARPSGRSIFLSSETKKKRRRMDRATGEGTASKVCASGSVYKVVEASGLFFCELGTTTAAEREASFAGSRASAGAFVVQLSRIDPRFPATAGRHGVLVDCKKFALKLHSWSNCVRSRWNFGVLKTWHGFQCSFEREMLVLSERNKLDKSFNDTVSAGAGTRVTRVESGCDDASACHCYCA